MRPYPAAGGPASAPGRAGRPPSKKYYSFASRGKQRLPPRSYFYDAEIGNFHYGQGHPMKPHRVRMTHNLVVNYGLYRMMEVFRPKPVNAALLTRFHSDDYVNFLKIITPDNMHEYLRQLQRFNVGEDCPVFDGLFEFCQLYTSGSIGLSLIHI